MNKLIHSAVFIAIALILPLAGKPSLLIDPRVAILVVAGIFLLVSQPTLDLREATAHRAADRASFLLILLAGLLSQMGAVVEWAYLREFRPFALDRPEIIGGLALWIGGLTLRIWAIRTLGRFFTVTVQRVEGHRVIKHGPYAIVRHPSYLGATVAMVGTSVLLGAWVAGVVSLIMLTAAYAYRIAAEERLLTQEFGEEFSVYRTGTPGLIPGSSCRQWARVAAALSRQLEKSTPMLD